VSYSLEWNGLKFAYSGDTTANKWFLENAGGSDVVAHECSDPVEVLIESRNHLPESAWLIATSAHTQPELAGQLFSELNPRMAICFHYVDDGISARQRLWQGVRNVYSGPLSIARDMMVWNVTPEQIEVRQVVGGEYSFSLPRGDEPPDQSELIEPSDWLTEGRVDSSAVYRRVLENLEPEYRKRILDNVPPEKLPPME
jgi:ribonuclease Z